MKWVDIARNELGVSEVAGKVARPRILEYFAAAGHAEVKSDETAWCSAFVNFCMEQAGIKGTMSLAARSWLRWGKEVKAQPGAVGVWPRGKSAWQGHRLDGDRRHVHERTVQSEHLVHQDGVLIDLLLVNLDEALAHGLDVANASVAPFQRGKQAQGRGGLAVVLPRGRDEDARGFFVEEHGSGVAGQVLPGAGIELGVLDALEADDGGDAEDVVGAGAARHVRSGAVQAQQHLPVGVRPSNVLDHL